MYAWLGCEKALVGGPYRDQDWESPNQRVVAAESNVRAVLRVRGTSKLTDLGLRYCANERLTGFVEDDARVLNRSQRLQREVG